MKKVVVVAILAAIGWYGNQQYQNNELSFLQKDNSGSSSYSSSGMTKCIAQDGQVYYGKVPAGVNCARTEAVKGSVEIISSKQFQPESEQNNDSSFFESRPKVASSRYSCTGKQHCSQMSSCAEAKFYIQNCPNTKMDGDGDGVPCERQHCRGW